MAVTNGSSRRPFGGFMIGPDPDWEPRMQEYAREIAASLDVSDAILDGEIIAADETGRPQFYDLFRDTWAPAYVAFDLIWLNGADLRPLPLSERRRHLQNAQRLSDHLRGAVGHWQRPQ